MRRDGASRHSKHSRKWLTVLLCSGGAADVAEEGQRPRIKRNSQRLPVCLCLYALYKHAAGATDSAVVRQVAADPTAAAYALPHR